mmetsp:Transcript_14069/g.38485  ORF Transcript_14069/g.38485 Transcript_14069/m.38485 type:complete len:82 (-) Transcript_14069:396-641(-)
MKVERWVVGHHAGSIIPHASLSVQVLHNHTSTKGVGNGPVETFGTRWPHDTMAAQEFQCLDYVGAASKQSWYQIESGDVFA